MDKRSGARFLARNLVAADIRIDRTFAQGKLSEVTVSTGNLALYPVPDLIRLTFSEGEYAEQFQE